MPRHEERAHTRPTTRQLTNPRSPEYSIKNRYSAWCPTASPAVNPSMGSKNTSEPILCPLDTARNTLDQNLNRGKQACRLLRGTRDARRRELKPARLQSDAPSTRP